MSAWSDAMTDLSNALIDLSAFGEPVTLPDGVTIAQGVFDPLGEAILAPWSERGLVVRPSQQPNPVLHLASATAATLAEGEILTIGATGYRIALIDPPLGGLTRLELAPDTSTPDTDPEARWQ